MKVTMYALRVVGTNLYFPCPQGRGGRGGSHMEPTDFKGTVGVLPRLWSEARTAKIALAHWRNGKVYCHRYGGYDDFEEDFTVKMIPDRKTVDVEVVEVEVNLP